MNKNTNKNKKNKPFFPKHGSEDPHPLLIPLQNFELHHHTYSEDKKGFIGRDNLITQLVELLNDTRNGRGSYLIAGYRGSGKTSLINRVINRYKNDMPKLIVAKINLGHDAVLDTQHVLYNIINVLNGEFNK